jgi:rare lipoprotein A
MGLQALGLGRLHLVRHGAVALGCLAVAGCASSGKFASKVDPKYGVSASARVIDPGEPVPKGGGTYRIGKPYVVGGRTYVPEEGPGYRADGLASWYGDDFHGRQTANGEVFDMHSISAAHPTLPMPSYARVTNLSNRRSVIVRVNDRGPYTGGRLIDLSVGAANLLGFYNHGLARVRVEYVGSAPLEGSDDRMLMATLRDDGPAPAPSLVMVASAKPFIPEISERVASPVRGSVPVPSARPFALGGDEPTATAPAAMPATFPAATATAAVPSAFRLASATSASEISSVARAAPRPNGPTMVWSRGPDPVVSAYSADPADPAGPVASFAPVRTNAPTSGLLSGRGLY